MEPTTWILICLVAAFVLTAAFTDLTARRIPNWLTVSSLAVALLFHTITDGLSGFGFSLAGFATGFSILLVLWLIGGGGGGDVKLMGALGSWMGAKGILYVFLCSSIFAAGAAVVMIISKVASGALAGRLIPIAANQSATRRSNQNVPDTRQTVGHRWAIPYALPVAAGTLCVLVYQYVLLPRM